MRNKKILFVTQYFFPEKVSSGILPYELACEFVKNDYEVKALVGYPKEYCDEKNVKRKEIKEGISIKRIRYPVFSRNHFLGRILNYLTFCISVLFHFYDFKNIDYCISYTNPPLLPPIIALYSKIFGFRYIFEIYDLYPDTAIKANVMKESSIIAKLFDRATQYALDNCWRIITLANECKLYIQENKNIDSHKMIVMSNWYKKQDKINIDTGKSQIVILYGGNMGVMQDLDTIKNLIVALKDDGRFKFIFAGHGNKSNIITDAIEKYNLMNCQIFDFLPKAEYDELLDEADMAIVSLEEFGVGLGSPSKLYGYLSKGLPILSIINSKTDVAKDVKEYACGIAVENGDYKEIIEQLNELYMHKDILVQMSTNSYNLFLKKYDLDIVSQKILEEIKMQFIEDKG